MWRVLRRKQKRRPSSFERILAQAAAEGVELSPAARRMLHWSETGPASAADQKVVAALAKEMTDEEFEARISGLLRRAYKSDVDRDPGASTTYREAYSKLSEGDHYILVMIDQALGPQLKLYGLGSKLMYSAMFAALVFASTFTRRILYHGAAVASAVEVPGDLIAFVVCFLFALFALLTGVRWNKGDLELNPWFAWFVIGAVILFLVGLITSGLWSRGIALDVAWLVVVMSVWALVQLWARKKAA